MNWKDIFTVLKKEQFKKNWRLKVLIHEYLSLLEVEKIETLSLQLKKELRKKLFLLKDKQRYETIYCIPVLGFFFKDDEDVINYLTFLGDKENKINALNFYPNINKINFFKHELNDEEWWLIIKLLAKNKTWKQRKKTIQKIINNFGKKKEGKYFYLFEGIYFHWNQYWKLIKEIYPNWSEWIKNNLDNWSYLHLIYVLFIFKNLEEKNNKLNYQILENLKNKILIRCKKIEAETNINKKNKNKINELLLKKKMKNRNLYYCLYLTKTELTNFQIFYLTGNKKESENQIQINQVKKTIYKLLNEHFQNSFLLLKKTLNFCLMNKKKIFVWEEEHGKLIFKLFSKFSKIPNLFGFLLLQVFRKIIIKQYPEIEKIFNNQKKQENFFLIWKKNFINMPKNYKNIMNLIFGQEKDCYDLRNKIMHFDENIKIHQVFSLLFLINWHWQKNFFEKK